MFGFRIIRNKYMTKMLTYEVGVTKSGLHPIKWNLFAILGTGCVTVARQWLGQPHTGGRTEVLLLWHEDFLIPASIHWSIYLRTCAKIFKNQIWPLSFLKLCPCSNNLNMTLLRLAAYYPKSSNLSKFIFFHSSKMELVTKCLQDWCLSATHNSYFMINISLAHSAQMASNIGCGFHQWTYVH